MPLACPYCNSSRFFKAGFRVTRTGKRIQRYLCRVCGRRFSLSPRLKVELNVSSQIVEVPNPGLELAETPSVNTPTLEPSLDEPPLPRGENVGSHNVSRVGESLNTLYSYSRNSREKESKKHPPADEPEMNLVTNEAMSTLVQQPGAAQGKANGELEGSLINFAWWLKKQGRSGATIENYCLMLRLLAKNNANLDDPESVKDVLARINKGLMWKEAAIRAYTSYLKMHKKTWEPPKINAIRKLPFIPTEAELDALITGCGPKTSALLRLLKETGVRVGEALRLTWSDIDMERRIITLNQPEKNGNPRI
ncbi:MAG: tyrosine-type recombinase/integrase, partial [Candidatus Jordarchaeales archaeon]